MALKKLVLQMMGLALLPAPVIAEAWAELKEETVPSLSQHEQSKWAEFKRYFQSYWMTSVGPEVFSVAFAPRRTNNSVENFNKLLNQRARVAHPSTYSFANVIAQEMEKTEADILALARGNPVRRDATNMFSSKETKISRWQQAVRLGRMNHSEFLCKICGLNKRYILLTIKAMEVHSRRLHDGGFQSEAVRDEEEQGEIYFCFPCSIFLCI